MLTAALLYLITGKRRRTIDPYRSAKIERARREMSRSEYRANARKNP